MTLVFYFPCPFVLIQKDHPPEADKALDLLPKIQIYGITPVYFTNNIFPTEALGLAVKPVNRALLVLNTR